MKQSRLAASAALGILAVIGAPAHADTFDNRSVIALAKAGIGDSVLLAKIAGLPCGYDVSTDQIIALKSAGVSNAVIAAMVDRCSGSSRAQGTDGNGSDPRMKRPAGLYIEMGDSARHDIRAIHPTTASGVRVSGNGSLLFPYTAKLDVPRNAAQTHSPNATPTFFFYFETDNQKVGDFGTSASASAQSPAEFSLVRFKPKDGQREMVIGKISPFSTGIGVNPKEAIQFTVDDLGDGTYSVQPNAPLPPGEYGFVLRAGSQAYRIYDFSVGS